MDILNFAKSLRYTSSNSLKNTIIKTPCFIPHTIYGNLPYLTSQLIDEIKSLNLDHNFDNNNNNNNNNDNNDDNIGLNSLFIEYGDIIDRSDIFFNNARTINRNVEKINNKKKQKKLKQKNNNIDNNDNINEIKMDIIEPTSDLLSLLCLSKHNLLTFLTPYSLKTNQIFKTIGNEFTVNTKSGKLLITTDEYVNHIYTSQPDFIISFSDEILHNSGKGRKRKSIERNNIFLNNLLDSLNNITNNNINYIPDIIAVLGGGIDINLRNICINNILNVKNEHIIGDKIKGILISELYQNETFDERDIILNHIANVLPNTIPKLVTNVYNLKDMIHLIKYGVDMISSTLPYKLTLEKRVLNLTNAYNLLLNNNNNENIDNNINNNNNNNNNKRQKISLNEKIELYNIDNDINIRDLSPLVLNCQCHSCKNLYTKAYIHHLSEVKELLGQVLIYYHNLYQIYLLFHYIRNSINNNTFHYKYNKLIEILDINM